MSVNISKSKYLSGLQCPKLLWSLFHDAESIPPYSAGTEAIFAQGHDVGVLAQSLYPGGLSIPWEASPADKLTLTQEALKGGQPIYEATFAAGGGYCQVDILVPDGSVWNIVEVKSSTGVKDVNLEDVAYQRYVCEAAGLVVGRCILVHLNNQYVREGELDIAQLFAHADLTEELPAIARRIPDRLAECQQVVASGTVPDVAIGKHCSSPYGCLLKERCWSFLPEHAVFDLYRGGQRSWKLLDEGVLSIADIGADFPLDRRQVVQRTAVQTGRPQVRKAGVQRFLKGLKYPLWLLDFETFQTAVPRYEGTKPYQQIPFQFSLHSVEAPGANPINHSWLAEGSEDPRAEFLTALQSVLGTKGDIVAFNVGFERARLDELARRYPEKERWLRKVNERFVDLITPFRNFDYYHPDQQGSCSLKAILPALTGKSYAGMAIAEGTAAAREFLRVEHGEVNEKDRQAVRQHLETYCEQDTLGMVWILDALHEVAVQV